MNIEDVIRQIDEAIETKRQELMAKLSMMEHIACGELLRQKTNIMCKVLQEISWDKYLMRELHQKRKVSDLSDGKIGKKD